MKQQLYRAILAACQSQKRRNCFKHLKRKFPSIPDETLGSIISQECLRKTKRNYHRHATPEMALVYYGMYTDALEKREKQGFLLNMADEIDLSPALLARIVLEQHYAQKGNEESSSKQAISNMMHNTAIIDSKELAVEVHICILEDENYGPLAAAIKHSIGIEYEEKLKKELCSLGVSFVDENALREKGYDKTPDIKLEVPIAVDGSVVNWIESKAMFGDEDNHKHYMKEQYLSYWNRFGPGLVIYWFGFIEEMENHKEQGILLRDHMPSVVHMDPSALTK